MRTDCKFNAKYIRTLVNRRCTVTHVCAIMFWRLWLMFLGFTSQIPHPPSFATPFFVGGLVLFAILTRRAHPLGGAVGIRPLGFWHTSRAWVFLFGFTYPLITDLICVPYGQTARKISRRVVVARCNWFQRNKSVPSTAKGA